MAFTYAYTLGGGDAPVIQDFGNGAAVPANGDMFIVASGATTTKAIATTANTNKVAVSLGANFLGLATGGTYAATNASATANTSAATKLILDPSAVYRIPWSASGASAVIGATYNLANTLVTQDQTLSPAAVNTANVNFILVENDPNPYPDATNGFAYVTIPTGFRVIPA